MSVNKNTDIKLSLKTKEWSSSKKQTDAHKFIDGSDGISNIKKSMLNNEDIREGYRDINSRHESFYANANCAFLSDAWNRI